MATVYEICLAASEAAEEWFDIDDLGITEPARTTVCASTDTLTFLVKGANAFTDDSLFADGAVVRYRRVKDGVARLLFLGRVQPHERTCDPSEGYAVEVRGMWDWFEDTPMRQDWIVDAGTIASPRVILFCAGNGVRMTTGAQIEQCVEVAREAGCPCAAPASGDIDAGFTPPFDEQDNIFVADAVCKALANHPHACCWFDYSERAPRLYVRTRQSLTSVSLSVAGKTGIRIKARTDLQPPAVAIVYQRGASTSVEYMPYVEGESDAARRARLSQSGVIWGSFELQPGSSSTVSQDIEVEAVPLTMDAQIGWLKSRVNELSDVADIDIELVSFTRSSGLSSPHPNILVKGALQNWMGVSHQRETFTAVVNIIDSFGGEEVARSQETFTVEVVTTTATTKTYRTLASYDSGETAPEGLAAALWAEWQQLHHDGVISIAEVEPSLDLAPGKTLNLTAGRAEWASMKAMIIRVTETFADGLTVCEFGVPGWIDLDSRVAWYRNCRTRRFAWSRRLRDETDDDGGGGIADVPVPRSGSRANALKRRRIYDPDAEVKHEIDLNPSIIEESDVKTLTPRKIKFAEGIGEAAKEREAYILCSEPGEPSEDTTSDPCEDHPEGGDGVGAGSDPGATAMTGQGGSDVVPAEEETGGAAAAACETQCEC